MFPWSVTMEQCPLTWDNFMVLDDVNNHSVLNLHLHKYTIWVQIMKLNNFDTSFSWVYCIQKFNTY